MSDRVPLFVGVTEENCGYLQAKRDRMGHQLPNGDFAADAERNRQTSATTPTEGAQA